jgi:hypothetical protein
MKKGIISAAELLRDQCYQRKPVMLTLTYQDPDAWKPRHISDLLKHVRHYLNRRGHAFPYIWVAEMQKRGAIHYHICLWLPRGITLPKPDKRGWWPHGSTRIEWARKPVGYMVKYASKGADGPRLPDSARMHGCGGLNPEKRNTRAYKMAPSWVRESFEEEDQPRRCPGGGWVSRINGEWLPSPWDVTFEAGFVVLKPRG